MATLRQYFESLLLPGDLAETKTLHTQTHMHTLTDTHTQTHRHTHTHTHIQTDTHTLTHMHSLTYTHRHIHSQTHPHTHPSPRTVEGLSRPAWPPPLSIRLLCAAKPGGVCVTPPPTPASPCDHFSAICFCICSEGPVGTVHGHLDP